MDRAWRGRAPSTAESSSTDGGSGRGEHPSRQRRTGSISSLCSCGLDEMPQEGVEGCVLFHRIF